ncbi:MAG: HAMP domain-containing sensor histidine kinase [Corynebacterium sp.]|uniref:sensor histidine kinase n=1 Tax=Corynebacterium sp. TaxID=1720 RepID=UPI0026DD0D07|nr:HAMP domain-containing sensor histidine kinase [Corynebacterium sp.]MDO5099584.1 HAMP domain-containing sensor histidine kinase [Corynebacterium sp.]
MSAALIATAVVAATLASVITAVIMRRCECATRYAVTDEQILAHEIRTPLSLIRSAAELLAQESDIGTEKRRRLVSTITSNSTRAIEVAETFLLHAKFNSGNVKATFTDCDLRSLLRETAQELRAISEVPIIVDDPGDPLVIRADVQLIRHALWNVINNAARYAAAESDIVVNVEETTTGVIITIADCGPGMSLHQQRDVFVPFAQFSTSTSTKTPIGAGLGMSITQKIVALHQGTVLIDSIAQHGTSVLITLPRNPNV